MTVEGHMLGHWSSTLGLTRSSLTRKSISRLSENGQLNFAILRRDLLILLFIFLLWNISANGRNWQDTNTLIKSLNLSVPSYAKPTVSKFMGLHLAFSNRSAFTAKKCERTGKTHLLSFVFIRKERSVNGILLQTLQLSKNSNDRNRP